MLGKTNFRFGRAEFYKSLKVFSWTVASALVALGVAYVGAWDLPVEFAFLVPVANTLLFAAKELIADNR